MNSHPRPSAPRQSGAFSRALRRLIFALSQGSEEAHRKAFERDLADLSSAISPAGAAIAEPPSPAREAARLRQALLPLSPLTAEGRALRQTLLHASGAPSRLPPPLASRPFAHARPARLLLEQAAAGEELSFNLDACAPIVEMMSHYRRLGALRWPNPCAAEGLELWEAPKPPAPRRQA